MSDTEPHQPWDADDDGSAPDGSAPDVGGLVEGFDAYIPLDDPNDEDEQPQLLVFRVTNPPGSVSVTVHVDGSIDHVELSPAVTRMTERQLTDEIHMIADLARDQARAGQHALLSEFMTELGHDPVSTHGFLKRGLGLPTPEDVNDEKARVFATRYSDRAGDQSPNRDDDWT